MKYLVSHQGQEIGPLTVEEIVGKVRSQQLDAFDYVYDESKADWILLMEHTEIAAKLKANKPPRPVVVAKPEPESETESAAHAISEWFVLKGENRFGAFSYQEIVQMLQQKMIFPFDFIWHAGMDDWKRVAEIEEFHPESIRKMLGGQSSNQVFLKRQFKRQPYAGRVMLHDQLKYWKGEGIEISEGGAGIKMENALIVPGQRLNVHFYKHGDIPAFNAVCEVVSKKFVNDNSPVEYGLRFLSMSHDVQDEFKKRVA